MSHAPDRSRFCWLPGVTNRLRDTHQMEKVVHGSAASFVLVEQSWGRGTRHSAVRHRKLECG